MFGHFCIEINEKTESEIVGYIQAIPHQFDDFEAKSTPLRKNWKNMLFLKFKI
jgi:hypothetical protein